MKLKIDIAEFLKEKTIKTLEDVDFEKEIDRGFTMQVDLGNERKLNIDLKFKNAREGGVIYMEKPYEDYTESTIRNIRQALEHQYEKLVYTSENYTTDEFIEMEETLTKIIKVLSI